MKAKLLLAVLLIALAGCYKGPKEYEPEMERKVFLPSLREAAPPPIYKRTRWVQLPEVMPAREVERETPTEFSGSPTLHPIFQFTLQNSTLLEASRLLAALARYQSYCSPSLASQKFSYIGLGTIDELAAAISKQAKINVVVDHDNREVRFLTNTGDSPTS